MSRLDPPEQYFPTYQIEGRARYVATKEYEAAIKTVDGEEKIFAAAAAVELFASGAMFSFFAPNINEAFLYFEIKLGKQITFLMAILLNTVGTLMFLIYFAEKYKSIVYATRKIIVIRHILGIRYGKIQWVMPTDRLEGASNPYDIPMFPGWRNYGSFPALILIFYVSSMNFLICTRFSDELHKSLEPSFVQLTGIASGLSIGIINNFDLTIGVASAIFCSAVYRSKLFDLHENWYIIYAILIGKIFRYPVLDDAEAKLYRLKLAVYEAERMGLTLHHFEQITLFIEDRRFFHHSGISLRAIAGAVWRRLSRRKISGGSTITQQLARSIFVTSMRSKWRRKILEIPMAFWLEGCLNKNDILKMYICAVRYESHVIGIIDAIRHFFPQKELEAYKSTTLSKSEIFFLIERLSNIRSGFLGPKVQHIASQMKEAMILNENDLKELAYIYFDQTRAGRVRPADEDEWLRFYDWASSGGPA